MHPFQNEIMGKKAEVKMQKFVSESWILCFRYCRLEWKNLFKTAAENLVVWTGSFALPLGSEHFVSLGN